MDDTAENASANDKLLSNTNNAVIKVCSTVADNNGPICTLNEAIENAGNGIFHTYLLFVCGFCMMGVITETLGMSYIITSAECDLSLSHTDKGLVTGAAFFGVVLSSHFWGILSDAWGRRNVLLIAVSGCFLASLSSCFSANVVMFIFTRTLVGVFVAANAAISYAYLGEFHSDKTRAKAVTMSGIFMAFGMIYLPALAWAIIPLGRTYTFSIPFIGIEFLSWRLYLLLITLLNVLVLFGLVMLPESPKFLLSKNRHDEALNSILRMYKINGKSSECYGDMQLKDTESCQKEETRRNPVVIVWTQTCMLFRWEYLGSTFKTSFTMGGIFFASSGLYMWTIDILNKMIQHKGEYVTTCQSVEWTIGTHNRTTDTDCQEQIVDTLPFIVTLLMSIVFAVCYFLNGIVIKKIGKRNLLLFWTTTCGISSLVLVWANNFYTILFFMLVLLASGCCGSIISAIAIDLFPTNIKAMALSFCLMIGRLCAAIGSNIIGWLLLANCDAVFYLVGAVLLASTAVGLRIPGR